MAKIEVQGTVAKVFYGGKAASVVETFKGMNGEMMKRYYTAWFENPVEFGLGATGIFSGMFSAKIEKWVDPDGNPKLDNTGVQGQSVRVSINGATFQGTDAVIQEGKASPISDFEQMGWTEVAKQPAIIDDTPF